MKKLVFFILSLVLVFSSVPLYALPDNSSILSTEEMKQLLIKFDSVGVPKEKQSSLLQKINNGELIDSLNPAKKVLLPKDFNEMDQLNVEKIFFYPDGSYEKFTTVEVTPENREKLMDIIGNENEVNNMLNVSDENSMMQPMLIQQPGTVLVDRDVTVSGCRFMVSYCLRDNGTSSVDNAYDVRTWAHGGTTSGEGLTYKRTQSGSTPASVRLTWKYTVTQDAGNYWFYCTFFARDFSTWTEIGDW